MTTKKQVQTLQTVAALAGAALTLVAPDKTNKYVANAKVPYAPAAPGAPRGGLRHGRCPQAVRVQAQRDERSGKRTAL